MRRLAAVAAAALGGATLASAAATTTKHLGPVPRRVLYDVRHDFRFGGPRMHAPKVSARAAVSDAQRAFPNVGPPNGVSLLRVTPTIPRYAGDPVWLVSFQVIHGTPPNGPADPGHHLSRHPHASNYLVVAIDVYSGRWLTAVGGYA